MSKVKVTLAASIAVLIATIALVLTGAPPRIARATASVASTSLGVTQSELAVCQTGETLPAGVTAIRASLVAFLGSNMYVVVYDGDRVVTEGRRNPAWSGSTVTIPVKPVAQTVSNVEVCVAFAPNSELIQVFGTPLTRAHLSQAAVAYKAKQLGSGPPSGARLPLRGRVQLVYLAPGTGSWWSSIGSIVKHMGFGHFVSGSAVALLAALLMAAVGVLTVRLALREQP